MPARGNSHGVPSASHGSGCSTCRPVHDVLREHAVLVADAVAEGGQAERRHRVEEAGRQPPQAAVAQRRVGFLLLHVLEPPRVGRHGRGGVAAQVERRQRVAEAAADQELHRQVIDAARLGGALRGLGLDPALGQLLPRHLGDGAHQVGGVGLVGRDADAGEQFVIEVDDVVVHGDSLARVHHTPVSGVAAAPSQRRPLRAAPARRKHSCAEPLRRRHGTPRSGPQSRPAQARRRAGPGRRPRQPAQAPDRHAAPSRRSTSAASSASSISRCPTASTRASAASASSRSTSRTACCATCSAAGPS